LTKKKKKENSLGCGGKWPIRKPGTSDQKSKGKGPLSRKKKGVFWLIRGYVGRKSWVPGKLNKKKPLPVEERATLAETWDYVQRRKNAPGGKLKKGTIITAKNRYCHDLKR